MPAGVIDVGAFDREVGSVIAKASAAGGPVRVYGEMVQLLWDAGHVVAALELEGLWNEVIGEHRCSLMCAYRSSSVSGAEHSEALERVCELHSSVFHAPVGEVERTGHGQALGPEIVAQFLPEPEAPRAARRFVADTLWRSGHATALVDDAQLTVSELATNAVIHARTAFSVAVQSLHRGVRLSVRDASRHRAVIRDRASTASGGRGLRLVAALAADWGIEVTTQGKTVWVQLAPDLPSAPLRRATTFFEAAPPANAPVSARSSPASVRAGRSNWSELYGQMADTLERSAELLERHAWHERDNGRQRAAHAWLQRAERAREAAQRARDHA